MAPIPITVVDKCKPTVVAEGINSSNLNENISESEDNNDEEDNNNKYEDNNDEEDNNNNDNINNNNNNNNNIDDNNNNNIDANNNNIDDHNDVDEEDDDEEDEDDDDYAYPESPLLLASKRKRLIAAAVKRINTLPSVNRDTLSFLSKYQTVSGTPPPNYQRWVSRSQKKAKRHRDVQVVDLLLTSPIVMSLWGHCIFHPTMYSSVVILITDISFLIFMDWQSRKRMDHPQCPTWSLQRKMQNQ